MEKETTIVDGQIIETVTNTIDLGAYIDSKKKELELNKAKMQAAQSARDNAQKDIDASLEKVNNLLDELQKLV